MLLRTGNSFRHDVTPPDETKYIGRFVKLTDTDGRPITIEIEHIAGCKAEGSHSKYVVNHKYLVSVIDLICQMEGIKLTAQEVKEWERNLEQVDFKVVKNFGQLRKQKGIWRR